MKLARIIRNTVKEHTELVSAGIHPRQALNIVYAPLHTEHLEQCLNRLTVNQIDELVKCLSDRMYYFRGKKAVYMIGGIIKETIGYRIVFTDCALQIDTIEVIHDELTELQQEDILSAIRQVI